MIEDGNGLTQLNNVPIYRHGDLIFNPLNLRSCGMWGKHYYDTKAAVGIDIRHNSSIQAGQCAEFVIEVLDVGSEASRSSGKQSPAGSFSNLSFSHMLHVYISIQ